MGRQAHGLPMRSRHPKLPRMLHGCADICPWLSVFRVAGRAGWQRGSYPWARKWRQPNAGWPETKMVSPWPRYKPFYLTGRSKVCIGISGPLARHRQTNPSMPQKYLRHVAALMQRLFTLVPAPLPVLELRTGLRRDSHL